MKAKYIITDTFVITARGLVLAGILENGTVASGDYIEFTAYNKKRKRKITGIASMRKADSAQTNTSLMIKCEDDDEILELRKWRPKKEVGVISKE